VTTRTTPPTLPAADLRWPRSARSAPNHLVSGHFCAVCARFIARGGSTLAGLDRLGQLRGDLEQIADDAEVGDLEDRRLLVLVHRDPKSTRLNSRHVSR